MQTRSAAVLIAFIVALSAPARGADLAKLVPEDVLLYAEVNDPAGIWADFEQSGLRDIIRSVPQAEMQLRLIGAIVKQVALTQFGVQWDDFVARHAKHLALVLPDAGGPAQAAPVVLLDAGETRADLEKLLRGTAEATLKARNPQVAIADEAHGDATLRVIKGPGSPVAYAFVGDALTVGKPDALKRLLDGRTRRPLAANEPFTRTRTRLAVAKGVVAYLNLGRLLADNAQMLNGTPELARRLDDLGVSHSRWLAFSSAFDGRGVRDRIYLFTGERKLGLTRLLGSLTPGETKAAALLPKDCPLLVSIQFKDGPELWKAILAFIEEGGNAEGLMRIDEGKRNVFLQFGIRFDEDLVGALGGEFFLAANPDFIAEFVAKRRMPAMGDFPFIVGLRVAKPEALKVTIHNLVASQPAMGQGVERKVEPYKGIEINTLTAPGTEARPAYAFVGDYLLVARSDAILRQCIDAKAAGDSLAAAPRYRAVAEKKPPKHNALLFGDIQGILTALVAGQPASPVARIAEQLRGACLTVAAEDEGVLIDSYSRPGLLPLLGALAGFAQAAPRPAPAAGPALPKPADF